MYKAIQYTLSFSVSSPFAVFLRAYLVWLGCLVPGLYEVIQYPLSLSRPLPLPALLVALPAL